MVKVYTKDYCPYCEMAKRLLSQRGIEFEEVKLGSPEEFMELKKRTGMQTVPQIFWGDQLIGGFDQLSDRDKQDQLEFMKSK